MSTMGVGIDKRITVGIRICMRTRMYWRFANCCLFCIFDSTLEDIREDFGIMAVEKL